MRSIDNLREYVTKQAHINEVVKSCVIAYIDKIEREVADMVPLPVDADDVPIYAGDFLDGYGKTIEVVELRIGRSGWVIVSRDGNAYADCAAFTHHHAPTVEDVLREFSDELWNSYCIGGTASDSGVRELEAEFAEKLRLAGEDA